MFLVCNKIKMTTIQLQVPKTIVGNLTTWKWENRLKKLWEYRQDQEDIKLVESEMKKNQK